MSAIEEKKRRLREAGIPLPISQINEGALSNAHITSKNSDMFSRLQALKSGANRQVVQQIVKATNNSGPSGFQGIPEPKMKKNPNHPQNKLSDPNMAVKPMENFGPVKPIDNELKMIEDMMGNTSSYYNPQPTNQSIQTNQPDLTVQENGYGPEFNPSTILAKKKQEMQEKNKYIQYAVNPNLSNFDSEDANLNQQSFDIQNMKKMMEQIAKNTISEVLNNYTEQKVDKLTFEYVNAKTDDGSKVIKTQDGKFFKIIPVKIKNN